jgi:hypothetical protein
MEVVVNLLAFSGTLEYNSIIPTRKKLDATTLWKKTGQYKSGGI